MRWIFPCAEAVLGAPNVGATSFAEVSIWELLDRKCGWEAQEGPASRKSSSPRNRKATRFIIGWLYVKN
jgi:hypothetical protein